MRLRRTGDWSRTRRWHRMSRPSAVTRVQSPVSLSNIFRRLAKNLLGFWQNFSFKVPIITSFPTFRKPLIDLLYLKKFYDIENTAKSKFKLDEFIGNCYRVVSTDTQQCH